MTAWTLLFVAVAILIAVAVLFSVALAVRTWVFELTPREFAYYGILAFSLGVLTTGWFDGDGVAELVGGLVIFLAVVWWIYRLTQRWSARGAARRGARA